MKTEWNWNEFCELYYETAKKSAEICLNKQAAKLGGLDPRVDRDYVRDSAALTAMEKAYAYYDASRGARITTFLSNIVHNEIVDLLKKETKAAADQRNIDDVKSAIKTLADEDSSDAGASAARAKLIPRLRAAIEKLSPSDQIILSYYLEDKDSYVSKAVNALQVSENYVSVRRHRIFKLLPTLMEMNRADYQRFCYEYEGGVFASDIRVDSRSISFQRSSRVLIPFTNPINPSLDLESMAVKLLEECGL